MLGMRFPGDYRAFLSEYNSAIPEPNVFVGDSMVSVERFISVDAIANRTKRIDGFPQDGVAIAESPSGNFVFIAKGNLGIYFWDHEIEGERSLASSFSEFVSGLHPFDADSIELQPGQVKSVWVDPSFKPEFE
jgi:hypothetical protein